MLQKCKALINDLPLRKKIVAIVLVTEFVLVGFCSLFGLRVVLRENDRILYDTIAGSLSYSATQLQTALTENQRITTALATDDTLQTWLTKLAAAPEDVVVRSNAFRQLSNTLQTYARQYTNGDMNFVSLYAGQMVVHTNTARAQNMSAALLGRLQEQANAADGRPAWVWDADGGELYLVCQVRQITPFNLSPLGVLIVSANLPNMVQRCADYGDRYEQAYYLLADETGERLYAPGDLPGAINTEQLPASGSYLLVKSGAHRYFAVTGTVPGYGWVYTGLVLYDPLYRAKGLSVGLYLGMLALSALLAAALCSLLINRLTRHIDTLIEKMRVFGENEAALVPGSMDYSARGDEIGVLHRQFDKMANKIVSLIQIDYTNQLLMKDAQLKALEAQIDPHFLYNVLASINWRAKAIGADKISQMVEALSRLLRATLSGNAGTFTLRSELSLVRDYATIQQIRFEDQLDFSMEVPDALLETPIPKLTVQPLVENAIRYAMQEGNEQCDVHICAECAGGELRLQVMNSGSEFPPRVLEQLEAGELETHGFGIGILNIQKRLRLTFGEPYGLSFTNRDGWAVAQITIPCRAGGDPAEKGV